MDSLELLKFLTPEILFGVGALQLAGQYGRNLAGRKALIVSDPGVLAAGWTQKVVRQTASRTRCPNLAFIEAKPMNSPGSH